MAEILALLFLIVCAPTIVLAIPIAMLFLLTNIVFLSVLLLLLAVPFVIGVPLSVLWALFAAVILLIFYFIRPHTLGLKKDTISSTLNTS